VVHPFERLRYVARASGGGVTDLVEAAARALAALDGDHAGLVTGCRQMVDRHPAIGPLWWLTSRMLCAGRPAEEAWATVSALEADETPRELASALPEDAVTTVLGWGEVTAPALHRRGDLRVRAVDVLGLGEAAVLVDALLDAGLDAVEVPEPGLGAAVADADVLLIEALAVGPDGIVAVSGSRAAAAVARHAGRSVWVVAGTGRLLPGRLWDALLGRLDALGEPWDAAEEVVPLGLADLLVGPWGALPPAAALEHTDCPIAAELFKGVFAPGTYRGRAGHHG
jgi:hypothetical protein